MDIIDLILVMDTAGLLAAYPPGSPEAPNSVDQPLIYMMVRQANAVFGEASKELKISARTGDILRWRASSLSLNSDSTAALYKFFALRGSDLLSPPAPLLAQIASPLPNPADPLHPGRQEIANAFWQSTILAPGNVTYAFQFMVLDRDNNPLGYFSWDPFITISD